MSSFKRLEEIEAWQKARQLTREVYSISGKGEFVRDFALRDQVRRSAISIMSNIAEGFGRGGNKEFAQFLSIAKGSVSELQSQLVVALDLGYIDRFTYDSVWQLADETGKMVGGLLRYLMHTKVKGSKYK